MKNRKIAILKEPKSHSIPRHKLNNLSSCRRKYVVRKMYWNVTVHYPWALKVCMYIFLGGETNAKYHSAIPYEHFTILS